MVFYPLIELEIKKLSEFIVGYKKIISSKKQLLKVISNELIKKYDTIFHLTLEIKELSFQKYDRLNIEQIVTNFF